MGTNTVSRSGILPSLKGPLIGIGLLTIGILWSSAPQLLRSYKESSAEPVAVAHAASLEANDPVERGPSGSVDAPLPRKSSQPIRLRLQQSPPTQTLPHQTAGMRPRHPHPHHSP